MTAFVIIFFPIIDPDFWAILGFYLRTVFFFEIPEVLSTLGWLYIYIYVFKTYISFQWTRHFAINPADVCTFLEKAESEQLEDAGTTKYVYIMSLDSPQSHRCGSIFPFASFCNVWIFRVDLPRLVKSWFVLYVPFYKSLFFLHFFDIQSQRSCVAARWVYEEFLFRNKDQCS